MHQSACASVARTLGKHVQPSPSSGSATTTARGIHLLAAATSAVLTLQPLPVCFLTAVSGLFRWRPRGGDINPQSRAQR